jgi:hypothetical protein
VWLLCVATVCTSVTITVGLYKCILKWGIVVISFVNLCFPPHTFRPSLRPRHAAAYIIIPISHFNVAPLYYFSLFYVHTHWYLKHTYTHAHANAGTHTAPYADTSSTNPLLQYDYCYYYIYFCNISVTQSRMCARRVKPTTLYGRCTAHVLFVELCRLFRQIFFFWFFERRSG